MSRRLLAFCSRRFVACALSDTTTTTAFASKSTPSLINTRFLRTIHRHSFKNPKAKAPSPSSWWQTPRFRYTVKMSSVAGGVTAVGSAGLYAVVSNPAQMGARPEEAAQKSHHLKNGKGFVNPWDSYRDASGPKVVLSLLWRKISGQQNNPDTTPPTVPIRSPAFLPSRETKKLRATWLGHACYYVEFPSGLRVLFDPVFEDCCAPVNVKSLKRYTPPPCEIEDLPIVDAVVISHNHYDHLSYPTIKRIEKKFPNAHFFAPLGNKIWFEKSGVPGKNVTELDWWDTKDVTLKAAFKDKEGNEADDVSVTPSTPNGEGKSGEEKGAILATIGALPCQHVSARGPFDRCKTLWASWSVESGGAKVYFAGDTGYRSVPQVPAGVDDYSAAYSHLPICPAFSEIGQHRGPFDLGLIPIGAYEPRFIMSPVHASPKDSANIFVDTKCRRALGMHWGTWVLTEEDVMEPPRKLREALREKAIEEEGVFDVCDIGETREFESGM